MKKNTMMRVASVLLVAVLLSTCVISSTFAKYVTSASGTDTARVAKWNITMDNTGKSTFVTEYDASDDDKTVVSATDVVAPGTSGSALYKVLGTPETDYVITFDADSITDVYLGAGTYSYTDAESNAIYSNSSTTIAADGDYYPIKYYITVSTTNGAIFNKAEPQAAAAFEANTKSAEFGSLASALAALESIEVRFTNNTNITCDLVVTIEWAWAFDNTTMNAKADIYDTILGDLTDNKNNGDLTVSNGADYKTNIAYTLTLTATQIGDDN